MARQGFLGSFAALEFNGAAAKLLLHNEMQRIMKEGVRAWVTKALNIDVKGHHGIPMWSGASRGTLQRVADIIGEQISYFVAPGAPDNFQDGYNQTRVDFVIRRGSYTFRYVTNLFHLTVNEDHNVNTEWPKYFNLIHPGPYNFVNQCNEAFVDAVNGEIRKLSFASRIVLRNLQIRTIKL